MPIEHSGRPPDPESLLPLKPIVFDILVILADGERHGWGIVKALEGGSAGWKKILPGNLYRTLRDMKALGLIEESEKRPDPELDDERRRYFRLSGHGRSVAQAEARRLNDRLAAARAADLLPAGSPPLRSERHR